jgi:hypothetical protein
MISQVVGGTRAGGTHAVPWVTSVNPGHAIKGRDEPCWGFLLEGTHGLPGGKGVRLLQKNPRTSSELRRRVFVFFQIAGTSPV